MPGVHVQPGHHHPQPAISQHLAQRDRLQAEQQERAQSVNGVALDVHELTQQLDEKINLLKAYGAEVVMVPTNVPPDSPESYGGVARQCGQASRRYHESKSPPGRR